MKAEALAIKPSFIEDVRSLLHTARRQAYAAANVIMVEAYWQIGQRIVEEEQGGNERAEYGSDLIRALSRQLGDDFRNGVSVANLRNFRQFYLIFPEAGKRYALRSELTWSHWRLVMRVADDNPTLGIILCADKDDTIVRYSVLSESQQLFASKYRLILPSEEELRDELHRRHILQLPAAEQTE